MKKPIFLAGKTFEISQDQVKKLHKLGFRSIRRGQFIKFAPISHNGFTDFNIFDIDKSLIRSAGSTDANLRAVFVNSTPIELSSIKNKGTVTMLKKVTNFVEGLKQPKKTYMRLGWLEVVDDDWVVTPAGKNAMSVALLVEDTTIEEFAKKELARLEKEEKSKK